MVGIQTLACQLSYFTSVLSHNHYSMFTPNKAIFNTVVEQFILRYIYMCMELIYFMKYILKLTCPHECAKYLL